MQIILKNGFRFQGKLLKETDTEIILDEVKNGRMIFDKAGIIARNFGDEIGERGKRKAFE